jgi:drug/metabolite transporter (DMT)-like permease
LVTQTHPQHLDSEGKVETIGLLSRKPVQDALIGSLAGLFFGLFFICLSQIKSGDIFGPLAVSKLTSFLIGIILILIFRVELAGIRNNPATIWVGILAGFLDVFANALYLLATRLTRLDVAVVLTSLYPVGTVFLSYLLLKERINRLQWAGVWLCLLAIMLIAS